MMTHTRGFLWLCLFLASTVALFAHQHELHGMASETLGKVSFETSCSSSVQSEFNLGVAALHSFEYAKASESFGRIAQQEPGCAMAYWGKAMSLYHQLWNEPSAKDLAEGLKLVEKAQAAPSSPREQEYIEALRAFYKPGKQSVMDRATAYSQGMGKLHEHYPSDEEATVFYALSLLGSTPPADIALGNAKKAVRLLNDVLAIDPTHPGVAHYLIHACDNPSMAKEGLPAARAYALIAPSSPHALHMPSHIFARLGLWQEDISSNLAAVAAAERAPSGTEARLHPMDFLEYAYLQTGEDQKARAIDAKAVSIKDEGFTSGLEPYYFYVQAHFPALLALETKDWKGAELLQGNPTAEPGAKAITYWAQAVGAGHLGDRAAAEAAVRNFDEAQAAADQRHPNSPAPPVITNQNEAHAWLAFAKKDYATAFELIKPVIRYQDEVGKREVELPAREMYADMLLELNRPAEALEQYRLSLKSDPNRFNGLYGAARSAELMHQDELAATYYKQLLDNCNQGKGSERTELRHAQVFLAR